MNLSSKQQLAEFRRDSLDDRVIEVNLPVAVPGCFASFFCSLNPAVSSKSQAHLMRKPLKSRGVSVYPGFGGSFEVGTARPRAKLFAIRPCLHQAWAVNQPLALVFYESLLPGTQLVNRLQDLGYRVTTASNSEQLLASATQDKPMLVLADLASRSVNVAETIAHLRQNPATSHLPVIAFADDKNEKLQAAARKAGATLVVNDSAILSHLQQFLDQALQLD